MSDLCERIRKYNQNVKLQLVGYCYPQNLEELYYFSNVDLECFYINYIMEDVKDFDNIIGLRVDLNRFQYAPDEVYGSLFVKFNRLVTLTVTADSESKFDYLKRLTGNNPIRTL